MIRKLLKTHPYKIATGWAIIIFILCATPGQYIPTTSWLELLSFDKWVHAGVFFVLSALFFIAVTVNDQPGYFLYLFCVGAMLYGGSLEIMQAKIFSQRSADWQDFVANSFGCVLALLLNKRITRVVLK